LTRVICEYWPSGLPMVSGLWIVISAAFLDMFEPLPAILRALALTSIETAVIQGGARRPARPSSDRMRAGGRLA
jgi:hypothetical protein